MFDRVPQRQVHAPRVAQQGRLRSGQVFAYHVEVGGETVDRPEVVPEARTIGTEHQRPSGADLVDPQATTVFGTHVSSHRRQYAEPHGCR